MAAVRSADVASVPSLRSPQHLPPEAARRAEHEHGQEGRDPGGPERAPAPRSGMGVAARDVTARRERDSAAEPDPNRALEWIHCGDLSGDPR